MMLGNICNKNILVRFVCMIMLILIQFDVFVYDMIYASQQSDICVTHVSTDDGSVVSQSSDVDSEWSDPFYKDCSRRPFSCILNFVISEISSLVPLLNSIDRSYRLIPENTHLYTTGVYILFRVLLI